MSNFVTMERVNLRNNPNVKEDMIQEYIFKNPTVLGLGDVTPIQREKVQPSGGRLDILLANDQGTRYEVEIQLGATDPSHIIRTLEYWDLEKKRYPQYDHVAVIVAEEITGRFMNVIQMFNGSIPLIAIQMSAYKNGENLSLTFTKVIDRIILGTEDEESLEVTDRNYWENRSTTKMLRLVDEMFKSFGELTNGYEFKYNKFYIGLSKDGIVKNFISFKPKKNYVYFIVKDKENQDKINRIESEGLEVQYLPTWNQYQIRINNMEEFNRHKELLNELVRESMEYFNID